MNEHTIRRYTHHSIWPIGLSVWLLVLTSCFAVGCGVDEFIDGDQHVSRSTKPSVPMKRAARWEGVRCFPSFSSFKRAMEAEGHSKKHDGKSWHHIVAQHAQNKHDFGDHDLHCTDNVVYIDNDAHTRLNTFYSTYSKRWGDRSFRDFLRSKSFDEQYTYGIRALEEDDVTYAFVR